MAQVSNTKATWTLLDASRSSFRQLDRFFFVESCACNDDFDKARNDGKKNIYLAVQDADLKISIRSLNVIDNSQLKDEFVMDVKLKDGTEKLTSFGSKLTASGIMWLCVFNRNTVVGVDLVTKTVVHEIMNVPCPNDICLSPTDPNILYVAGGSSLKSEVAGNSTDEIIVVMPPIGCIHEVDIKKGDSRKLESSGDLSSLAGIDLVNGKLYISQLFNILSAPMTTGSTSTLRELTAWKGTDTSEQDCYFADNLSQWDETTLAVSIYRYMDAKSIPAMQNSAVSTVGWCCGKMLTSLVNCVTCAPNAIDNAELLMQFSTEDKFAHVHFVLLHAGAGDSGDRRWHFKLATNTLAKLPEGCEFDGHVTHVQRHGGKVVFVNFKSPCVLLLDEAVVLEAMK